MCPSPVQPAAQRIVRKNFPASLRRTTHNRVLGCASMASSSLRSTSLPPHNPRNPAQITDMTDPKTTILPPKTQQQAFATSTLARETTHRGRDMIWQTPNVVHNEVPTTLVTISPTSNTSSPTQLSSEIAGVLASQLNSLTSPTSRAPATSSIGKPFLEAPELALPAWPPLATFFLFVWLLAAWAVAVVLYCTSVPDKVKWLDRAIWGRRRRRGGTCEYVK